MDHNIEGVQQVRRLLERVTEYVNGMEFYPRGNVFLDRALLALLSKNVRVGESVCLLVEHGFNDEAFGVSRTMIEIALSVRRIVGQDALDRSARFARFYAKDHAEWTRLVTKHYPASAVEYTPHHKQMLEIAKGFKDPHRWSGLSAKQLALEGDSVELDACGNPTNWEFDYEVIYKWTSHFVHGTIISLDEHWPDLCARFEIMGGHQRIEKGSSALFNVAVYLFKTIVLVFRGLRYEVCAAVLQECDTVVKHFVGLV